MKIKLLDVIATFCNFSLNFRQFLTLLRFLNYSVYHTECLEKGGVRAEKNIYIFSLLSVLSNNFHSTSIGENIEKKCS